MEVFKIALDGGHGMETAGKRTPKFEDGSFMHENEFNRAVVQMLEKNLKENGFEIVVVAPETTDTPLSTRVSRANKANADFYISIHANAYGGDWNDANGIETFVHSSLSRLSDGYKLADRVQKQLVNTTGLRDRGVKSSSLLYVLNETKMQAMLIECGFMTNKKEAELLKSTAYRKTCADAICKGLCEFLGKPYTGGVQMDKPTETIPEWKIAGEKKLREMGATTQSHSPTELVDYGSLGIILSNLVTDK